MNLPSILLLVLIAAAAGIALRTYLRQRRRCDGCCSGCSACDACRSRC